MTAPPALMYGPELWHADDGGDWSYWDLWFAVLCLHDHGGDWDGFDAALTKIRGDGGEAKWSHLLDLRERLAAAGLDAPRTGGGHHQGEGTGHPRSSPGSLAVTLIDRAPCAVAVIRGSAPQVPPPRSGPIVVGVDGSEAGGAALDLAADVAASVGGRLLAVSATADVVAARAQAQLAAVRMRCPALPVEERVVDGTAFSVLAHEARDGRLLVIGRHHAGPGIDVVLGSTVHGLVESVPCPVLIADPGSGT